MRRTQSWRFWRFSRRRKSTKSTTFCPDHSEAPLAGAIQILRFPQLHYSATYRFLQLCLPSITPFRINLLSSLNPRQLAACSTSRMTHFGPFTVDDGVGGGVAGRRGPTPDPKGRETVRVERTAMAWSSQSLPAWTTKDAKRPRRPAGKALSCFSHGLSVRLVVASATLYIQCIYIENNVL